MWIDRDLVYSESRGTWNVTADGEWYFEGTYEQCEKIMDSFNEEENEYWEEQNTYPDDYYGDSDIEEVENND